MWDPGQYQRYGDERSRPFFELIGRIEADPTEVRSIVDLGCGPGNLTAALADRFMSAQIIGIDNDPAMLRSAQAYASAQVSFVDGNIATWQSSQPVDVLVANAALQWDLGHLERLASLAAKVTTGGWFAFQVPGNLDDPHHQAIREVRARPRWSACTGLAALPVRTHVSYPATTYLDVLAPISVHVDAWETSYVHILQGDDPILDWVKGTGLLPVLNALPDDATRAEFCTELAPLLHDAYPQSPYGTPFPFRRVFVVAKIS